MFVFDLVLSITERPSLDLGDLSFLVQFVN